MKKVTSFFILMLVAVYASMAAMPSKVFAPYVDVMLWPTFDLMNAKNATGQKYFTLAFITAGTDGQPAWGGSLNMASNHMLDQVNNLRASGGDVIISFGGAIGTPIASTITDVNALANAYESVINKYGVTWIDFDVEGWWVQDQASIDRRNQAAAILQSRKPNLRITYCLPVMPTGLTADGVNVINKAKSAGVNIYGVNIMAMDYGQSNQSMGQAAISAAQNTHNQTGLQIGVTPMIGKNDTANETFTFGNANELLSFANGTSWVNMLAMWSINRDNGGCPGQTAASATCSGLSQGNFDFVNVFKSYSGNDGGGDDGGDNDGGGDDNGDYISWEAHNQGGKVIRHMDSRGRIDSNVSPAADGRWKMVAGLAGTGVSFQSVNFPNRYLRHRNGEVWLDTNDGSSLFKNDATFMLRSGLADGNKYSFESYNFPGNFIRHRASLLYSESISDDLGRSDATFAKLGNGSLPGVMSTTIEAENYSDMSGIQVEACSEGGSNIAYVDTGDWIAYAGVNFPSTGSYTIEYRVASETGGGVISADLNAGTTVLGTVNVPATGGWQTWSTVSQTVNVTAGTYPLGIYAQNGGFNINWIKITSGGTVNNDNPTDDNNDGGNDNDNTGGLTGPTVTGEMTYYGPEAGFPTDVPLNAGGYSAADLASYGMNFCAMQTTNLMNDQLMGGCIEVTSPSGKKGKFLIVDKLPSGSPGNVDIYGRDVFGTLENPDLGRVNISWKIVALPTSGGVKYRFQEGSNEWWAALQIFNHKYPIQKVEYKNASGNFVTMARQSDGGNFFIASGMGTGPYTIRLTDYFGNVLTHTGVQMQSSQMQEMGSNFRTVEEPLTEKTLATTFEVEAYPNPASTTATFKYNVTSESNVVIDVYAFNGTKVSSIVETAQSVGTHIATIDVNSLKNGLYIAKITVNGASKTVKLIVNK